MQHNCVTLLSVWVAWVRQDIIQFWVFVWKQAGSWTCRKTRISALDKQLAELLRAGKKNPINPRQINTTYFDIFVSCGIDILTNSLLKQVSINCRDKNWEINHSQFYILGNSCHLSRQRTVCLHQDWVLNQDWFKEAERCNSDSFEMNKCDMFVMFCKSI